MAIRNINELLRHQFYKKNNLPEHHALYDAQAIGTLFESGRLSISGGGIPFSCAMPLSSVHKPWAGNTIRSYRVACRGPSRYKRWRRSPKSVPCGQTNPKWLKSLMYLGAQIEKNAANTGNLSIVDFCALRNAVELDDHIIICVVGYYSEAI
jgi:hypothetical protein